MTVVNGLLDRLFDLLFGVLRPLPLLASLAIVSLGTAVAMLLVVRATSNQRAVTAVKRQILADLFELRLFNDDLHAMWRAQLGILRHNATYLRLSLRPVLWTIVPFVLVVAQLECYFGYSGINVGQPVLMTAQWKSTGTQGRSPDLTRIMLEPGPGIRIETPAIWFPALQQAVWRIVAAKPGDYVVQLRVGEGTYAKTVHVSDGTARRSPVRGEPGLLSQLQFPSESPIPASAPLSSISVAYPERDVELFGRQMHWLTVYLALSVIFAFMLKTPLGVTI